MVSGSCLAESATTQIHVADAPPAVIDQGLLRMAEPSGWLISILLADGNGAQDLQGATALLEGADGDNEVEMTLTRSSGSQARFEAILGDGPPPRLTGVAVAGPAGPHTIPLDAGASDQAPSGATAWSASDRNAEPVGELTVPLVHPVLILAGLAGAAQALGRHRLLER